MAEYTPTEEDLNWINDESVRIVFVGTVNPQTYDEKRRAYLFDYWLEKHTQKIRNEMNLNWSLRDADD